MTYTFNIASPILVAGQQFRYRYREYPLGVFGAYAFETTNTITLTGLSANTYYELEVEFMPDDDTICDTTVTVFFAADDTVCPTFSGVIMSGVSGFYLRVSWSGVVGYPIGGYQIVWRQGAKVGVINYPTALPVSGFMDIPLLGSGAVRVTVYSDNGAYAKECFDDIISYSTPCTGLVISDVGISQDVNGSLYWILTIFFTQSSPVTLTSTITYVQTNGSAVGSFSALLSPTATSYSFSVYVVSFTGVRPTFNGTMTDACGNVRPWSI